jgi:hypothetical protein
MTILDYVKYLGLYHGEEALQPLLSQLGLAKAPKLAKGDITTHLSAKALGVELCFRDERFVKIPDKQFPEGALVLSNITFYGEGHSGYKTYADVIFPGITWGSTKPEVLRAFGIPNAPSFSTTGELLPGEDDWNMRWDRADHCLFFTFTDEGQISDAAIQLPLDQA